MAEVKRIIEVNGRTYELRKDATDPTQTFPYQLMTPLNSGCTKIDNNSFCCWIRGVIPPRQGTIEKPMEVVALGFTPIEVHAGALMHPNVLQSMHYYVANDETFMHDFAMSFLGMTAMASAKQEPAVSISPFPEPKVNPLTDGLKLEVEGA